MMLRRDCNCDASRVPFDALAYVFGRDASYWYRLYQALGQFSIVGTTIRAPEAILVNLVAD